MFFVKGTSEEHVLLKGKMACSSAYIQGEGEGLIIGGISILTPTENTLRKTGKSY